MCQRCEAGRFTDRATLLARRTAREYQRARDLNRARWAVVAIVALIVAVASLPCDLYPESLEPGRCARDHWSN
jgi:hypothetical protein